MDHFKGSIKWGLSSPKEGGRELTANESGGLKGTVLGLTIRKKQLAGV